MKQVFTAFCLVALLSELGLTYDNIDINNLQNMVNQVHSRAQQRIVEFSNEEVQQWADGNKCKYGNKPKEMCEFVNAIVNMGKASQKATRIAEKYTNEDGNPLKGDKLEKQLTQQDKQAYDLYQQRMANGFLQMCTLHDKIDANNREFLENLELRYNDTLLYVEAETNELCEVLKQQMKEISSK
ncbi:hypothetical protein CQA66_02875 [Helicobacter aurati]|uniref:Uncharacterized protein n=1 Tax=Helicobacter aurati TaxID=137778 RepID=A0A3D8J5T1_9HELI|nr:hypothetical protein [Helicobacter aurati]RDU72849.1 hypothetical protein CQA66_02875 [Helicobacter aurati]